MSKRLIPPKWNGGRLRSLRKKAGLTQEQLAVAFNKLSRNGPKTLNTKISGYENGREPKSYAHIVILASLLGVSPEDLFDQ
jgi:transcriptional regulator with XRE-family HTH domain